MSSARVGGGARLGSVWCRLGVGRWLGSVARSVGVREFGQVVSGSVGCWLLVRSVGTKLIYQLTTRPNAHA